MATIACDECNLIIRHDCAACQGSGEIDIDKADDKDVIDDCRGVNRHTDELILSQVMSKFGHEAFSYEALEFMADQYRKATKQREKDHAASRAHYAAQQARA
jgi:hypothetical protein